MVTKYHYQFLIFLQKPTYHGSTSRPGYFPNSISSTGRPPISSTPHFQPLPRPNFIHTKPRGHPGKHHGKNHKNHSGRKHHHSGRKHHRGGQKKHYKPLYVPPPPPPTTTTQPPETTTLQGIFIYAKLMATD